MLEPVSYILMYRGFAYSKLLRRLPYRGIVVYDVIGDGYRTFFNILLKNESPEDFFTSYAENPGISTPCTFSGRNIFRPRMSASGGLSCAGRQSEAFKYIPARHVYP